VSLTHSQVTVTYYSHCIILLLSSLLSQPKMALSLSNPNLSNSPLSSLREHTLIPIPSKPSPTLSLSPPYVSTLILIPITSKPFLSLLWLEHEQIE
jgi:hypothetical protein